MLDRKKKICKLYFPTKTGVRKSQDKLEMLFSFKSKEKKGEGEGFPFSNLPLNNVYLLVIKI